MAIRARTVGTPQSQAAALAELGAVVNSEGGLGRGVNRGSPGVMAGCIEYGDLLSVMEGRLDEALEFGRKVSGSVDGSGGTKRVAIRRYEQKGIGHKEKMNHLALTSVMLTVYRRHEARFVSRGWPIPSWW